MKCFSHNLFPRFLLFTISLHSTLLHTIVNFDFKGFRFFSRFPIYFIQLNFSIFIKFLLVWYFMEKVMHTHRNGEREKKTTTTNKYIRMRCVFEWTKKWIYTNESVSLCAWTLTSSFDCWPKLLRMVTHVCVQSYQPRAFFFAFCSCIQVVFAIELRT